MPADVTDLVGTVLMWDEAIRRAFEQLETHPDAHVRGVRFEELIQRLFHRARYRIIRNPGAARPRQTDLFARRGADNFLIETKWRKTPADVNDIDSMAARLYRMPSHVVGIFFSMAGFSDHAIEEVGRSRGRIILLFDGREIRQLCTDKANLRSMIRRKREHHLETGQVLLGITSAHWADNRGRRMASIPSPDITICDARGNIMPYVAGSGELGPVIFVQELPDVNWTIAQGSGVGFELRLNIRTRKDLVHVIDILNGVGWISAAGRYSIQQRNSAWYGAGAEGFLAALDALPARYAAANTEIHHTEEATYFDECEGGFFTLSMGIDTRERGKVWHADLSAQLPGIPLDLDPIRELVNAFDLEDVASFRPLNPEIAVRRRGWDAEQIRLEAIAFLCESSGEYVAGIVARNPFYGSRARSDATHAEDERLEGLDRMGFLVCRLSSWHQRSHAVDYYYLRDIHVTDTSSATVLDPVADWNAIEEHALMSR